MKPNLLNEDLKINEKWLEEPFNESLCKYLEGWCYFFDDLNYYNENLKEMEEETDMIAILSNLRAVEFKEGLAIEDLTDNYYSLYFISFFENKEIEIIHKL